MVYMMEAMMAEQMVEWLGVLKVALTVDWMASRKADATESTTASLWVALSAKMKVC